MAVYLTVINLVESRVGESPGPRGHADPELVLQPFAGQRRVRVAALRSQDRHRRRVGLPEEARTWMLRFPGRTWQNEAISDHIFKLIPDSKRFYRLTLPLDFYRSLLASLKVAVFAVLGIIYILAVLMLELVIMPRYVYQPLRLLLDADTATRAGDRSNEIIDESYIPGDEIGKILLSHNETVRALR